MRQAASLCCEKMKSELKWIGAFRQQRYLSMGGQTTLGSKAVFQTKMHQTPAI